LEISNLETYTAQPTHLRISLTAVVLDAWGPPVAMADEMSSLYILQDRKVDNAALPPVLFPTRSYALSAITNEQSSQRASAPRQSSTAASRSAVA
jgi:hypothetical protein